MCDATSAVAWCVCAHCNLLCWQKLNAIFKTRCGSSCTHDVSCILTCWLSQWSIYLTYLFICMLYVYKILYTSWFCVNSRDLCVWKFKDIPVVFKQYFSFFSTNNHAKVTEIIFWWLLERLTEVLYLYPHDFMQHAVSFLDNCIWNWVYRHFYYSGQSLFPYFCDVLL